jgi:hypothetical protein
LFAAAGCAADHEGGGNPDLAGGGGGDAAVAPDGGTPDLGARTTGVYLLYETFNAMATGAAPVAPWTVDANGGATVLVREIPFAADKSAELAKPSATGLARLSTMFPPQSGRVVFEAKVKARETAGFKAIPYIYDPSGNAVASIAFQDGNIEAHVGNNISMIQPFVANVWYRVRVVVDTQKSTFDLFIDGVHVAAAQALRTPAASVASVAYFIDGTNVGTLYVDNVKVYVEADFIGAPPAPLFDPRSYGAAGDGTTKDTAAIQQAIDAAAGSGGSVVLSGGTFLSSTLTLRSNMTFFIDSSATLLGSAQAADYPTLSPSTGNTQLSNCQRALLYAPAATGLTIDGGA